MCSDVVDSFKALSDLAKKSTKHSVGLPAQDEAIEYWNGIGFSLAGLQFVAAMGTVAELLHAPKYTIVPGVQSWVLGVSNIRGRLIPIIDLARYFGLGASAGRNRDKRVLVLEQGDYLSGLLVDSVQGMQHFESESFKTETQVQVPNSMLKFIDGAYQRNSEDWLVFDAKRLMNNDNFINVALSNNALTEK